MAEVTLEAIYRRLGQQQILENVTFTVPDGQLWVLVGASGCGKSTILRTVAGLDTPTSGEVRLGGVVVNQVPPQQRDVAMVFQNYALYPHMSVAQNLGFGLQVRGLSGMVIRQRVGAVAQMLGITDLLERKPRQLSGGQQQRVALGRAMARQPQVFLLDEPLSNLDPQLRDDTRSELKQLHQHLGTTMIYVTHDQGEAMTLGEQLVVLHRGRVQQIGTPIAVYQRPASVHVAKTIGTPPMNLLPAIYTGEGFVVQDQTLPWYGPRLTPGQGVEVGIRPEHCRPGSWEEPLRAQVLLTEVLGRETWIRGQVGSVPILWPGDSQNLSRPGEYVPLHLDPRRLFVFDSSTGICIHPA